MNGVELSLFDHYMINYTFVHYSFSAYQVKIWFQNRRVKYKKEGTDVETKDKCRCLRTCPSTKGSNKPSHSKPEECMGLIERTGERGENTDPHHQVATHAQYSNVLHVSGGATVEHAHTGGGASDCESLDDSIEEHIDCEAS